MSKIFFLLALLISNLLGCATCQLMVPTAEIKLSFGMKENRLCTIHAQWSFSDIYTSEITTQFDKNTNQILDASELQAILKIKKE